MGTAAFEITIRSVVRHTLDFVHCKLAEDSGLVTIAHPRFFNTSPPAGARILFVAASGQMEVKRQGCEMSRFSRLILFPSDVSIVDVFHMPGRSLDPSARVCRAGPST